MPKQCKHRGRRQDVTTIADDTPVSPTRILYVPDRQYMNINWHL